MKKTRIAGLVLSLCLAGACVCGLAACQNSDGDAQGNPDLAVTDPAMKGDGDGIAATVNGVEIAEATVTSYIENVRANQGLTEDDAWGQYLVSFGYTPADIREQVLNGIIDQELINQACVERGISADEEEVQSYVDQMRSYYDTDEEWADALAAVGYTEDEYREQIRSALESEALQQQILAESDTEPTDEELLEYAGMYASYYDGMRRSSHILFSADDEATAQEVLDQINSGELDFADAAKEYSLDGSGANGGDVGWDYLNSFVTEYSDALSNLEEGQVSGLVTSQYGIHIIKCTEVFTAPEEVTSLDQLPEALVDMVRSSLSSSNQNSAYTEWLADYREKADVTINEMPSGLCYDIDLTPYQEAADAAAAEAENEAAAADDAATDATADADADAAAAADENADADEGAGDDAGAEKDADKE